MKHILVIWYLSGVSGGIHSIEFDSKEACENASFAVIHASPYRKVETECLRKGSHTTDTEAK